MSVTSALLPSAAWLSAISLVCSLGLVACGSSSKDSAPQDDPIPASAAALSLSFHSVKTFRFSWSDVENASTYKLLENPDGLSGFTQVGGDIDSGIEIINHTVPLYARANAQYILQSRSSSGCVDSPVISVSGTLADAIGYFKARNTNGFIEGGSYIRMVTFMNAMLETDSAQWSA